MEEVFVPDVAFRQALVEEWGAALRVYRFTTFDVIRCYSMAQVCIRETRGSTDIDMYTNHSPKSRKTPMARIHESNATLSSPMFFHF